MRLAFLTVVALACASPASVARAQDGMPRRRVEIAFTPTVRTQLAIWIESEDGSRFQTIMLTSAVGFRGIGNRPGALQMNSGFRWPYGRREGVLPVWGHRRAEHSGQYFPRVIFAGRTSEGHASNAGSPGEVVNTRDDFFCLSFRSGDESLDAVTCQSVFMSNKGRYVTDTDLGAGYSEPWEEPGGAGSRMRALGVGSIYPPRQDLGACPRPDHDDVCRYVEDARRVMPELDTVTRATPQAEIPYERVFDVPSDWPDGDYIVYVEANTEADYAPGWDATRYPTPREPNGRWDIWALTNGIPYRGQPSVVYRIPVSVRSAGGEWRATAPSGYGDIHGLDGDLRAMDGTIRDDASATPGSGADRLRLDSHGHRVRVTVPTWDVCLQPDPPPDCGRECDAERPCAGGLLCGEDGTCVGMCDVRGIAPDDFEVFEVTPHGDVRHGHEYGHLRFVVPESRRGFTRFEVRVSPDPIVDEESWNAANEANAASADSMALVLPMTRDDGSRVMPGDVIEADFGGLLPQTRYHVALRSYDECNAPGEIAVAEIETTRIYFTTVSPCFVATAAYGSPLEGRVRALRRFRDRHLRASAPGRALVSIYEAIGPSLADAIRDDDASRAFVRGLLEPIVDLAEWLD